MTGGRADTLSLLDFVSGNPGRPGDGKVGDAKTGGTRSSECNGFGPWAASWTSFSGAAALNLSTAGRGRMRSWIRPRRRDWALK
jgi:hypothetical protein